MAYTVNLTSNQRLTITLQGNQTNINLVSSSPGQHQSQSSSFTTGNWQIAPKLYRTGAGFALEINGQKGSQFVLIQGNSIHTSSAPDLSNASQIELKEVADPPSSPNNMNMDFDLDFEPMQPMQPMNMGNMSMDINSMSMNMGNMAMNMNRNLGKTPTKRFCSQCGEAAKPSDRFCSSCGHQLN